MLKVMHTVVLEFIVFQSEIDFMKNLSVGHLYNILFPNHSNFFPFAEKLSKAKFKSNWVVSSAKY